MRNYVQSRSIFLSAVLCAMTAPSAASPQDVASPGCTDSSGQTLVDARQNPLGHDTRRSPSGSQPPAALAYAKVLYQQRRTGINLAYDHAHRQYAFLMPPGARPESIALEFEGEPLLKLDEQGSLLVRVAERTIRQSKPVACQETAEGRRQIEGRYVLTAPNLVGFRLASYDAHYPLLIRATLDSARDAAAPQRAMEMSSTSDDNWNNLQPERPAAGTRLSTDLDVDRATTRNYADYAGSYRGALGMTFSVLCDGDSLAIELPVGWGLGETALHADGLREFRLDGLPIRVRFDADVDGTIVGLSAYADDGGFSVDATRLPQRRGIVSIHDIQTSPKTGE